MSSAEHLGDAQAGRVEQLEDRPVAQPGGVSPGRARRAARRGSASRSPWAAAWAASARAATLDGILVDDARAPSRKPKNAAQRREAARDRAPRVARRGQVRDVAAQCAAVGRTRVDAGALRPPQVGREVRARTPSTVRGDTPRSTVRCVRKASTSATRRAPGPRPRRGASARVAAHASRLPVRRRVGRRRRRGAGGARRRRCRRPSDASASRGDRRRGRRASRRHGPGVRLERRLEIGERARRVRGVALALAAHALRQRRDDPEVHVHRLVVRGRRVGRPGEQRSEGRRRAAGRSGLARAAPRHAPMPATRPPAAASR